MLQQQDFLRKLILMNEQLQVSSGIASVKQSFIYAIWIQNFLYQFNYYYYDFSSSSDMTRFSLATAFFVL